MRSWKSEYNNIQKMYLSGMSPKDIALKYNVKRTSIKNIISNTIGLRSQSEASKLAVKQGKKNKAIKALIIVAKTTNRFHPSKSLPRGKDHPRWISDRSKLKTKRMNSEEKWFFKEVLKERNYICELTGRVGGKLSIHHIKPVWKYPELKFDKLNVIIILKSIHIYFHKLYGLKSNENDWNYFRREREYAICQ